MHKGRLEAFSDGVLAIIITIMVLELKVPHGDGLSALVPLIPIFLSYLLSFVYLAIYWNNHHHMFQTVRSVNGAILWANMHLLFWLSLVPLVTGWMGENNFGTIPCALYGCVLLLAAVSYFILQKTIILEHGQDSTLAKALGRDMKGKISLAAYALGIAASFILVWLALALYVAVALMWLIPDSRIEKALGSG